MSTIQEMQIEIDELVRQRNQLLTLLRHAVQRNHAASPLSCTPCEEIEKVLAES